jgi:hypothetical protein
VRSVRLEWGGLNAALAGRHLDAELPDIRFACAHDRPCGLALSPDAESSKIGPAARIFFVVIIYPPAFIEHDAASPGPHSQSRLAKAGRRHPIMAESFNGLYERAALALRGKLIPGYPADYANLGKISAFHLEADAKDKSVQI